MKIVQFFSFFFNCKKPPADAHTGTYLAVLFCSSVNSGFRERTNLSPVKYPKSQSVQFFTDILDPLGNRGLRSMLWTQDMLRDRILNVLVRNFSGVPGYTLYIITLLTSFRKKGLNFPHICLTFKQILSTFQYLESETV